MSSCAFFVKKQKIWVYYLTKQEKTDIIKKMIEARETRVPFVSNLRRMLQTKKGIAPKEALA